LPAQIIIFRRDDQLGMLSILASISLAMRADRITTTDQAGALKS
jgi:hypothetical protein